MKAEIREKSKAFRRMIDEAGSIAVIGHVHPDGDCIGSTLAVYNYICDNFKAKTVDVYTEEFSVDFMFLEGADKIHHEPVERKQVYDLAISIDVSDMDRLGRFIDVYKSAISTVCIDHHVSNPGFGDMCYVVPDASSACEALTDLIDMDKVSIRTANCLYLGIIHDTGVFKYSCTGPKTMDIAGMLIAKGVNTEYIIDETFYKKTYKQNLLMARTLLESNLYDDGRIIVGYITRDMFNSFKCTTMDTDGIVEQLRLTEGTEVAIFAYQITKKKTKFSLRAKGNVDVSKLAAHFGGGGHVKAAGFETTSSYNKVLKQLISMIEEQMGIVPEAPAKKSSTKKASVTKTTTKK